MRDGCGSDRSPGQRTIDGMVNRAARAVGVRLAESEVFEITAAAMLGVWDAVHAVQGERDAVIAAQFAGLPEQIAHERQTVLAARWWAQCAGRAAELRGRLGELRARDRCAPSL